MFTFLENSNSDMPEEATVIGTKGHIHIQRPLRHPTKMTVYRTTPSGTHTEEEYAFPLTPEMSPHSEGPMWHATTQCDTQLASQRNGFRYLAMRVQEAIEESKFIAERHGRHDVPECDHYTMQESVACLKILEDVRAQVGVVHPEPESSLREDSAGIEVRMQIPRTKSRM